MTVSERPRRVRRPNGPHPGVVGSISLVLSVASAVVPLAVAGTGFPTHASTPAATAGYFTGHSAAGSLTGLFAFGASVPLGIYAATMYARQLRLGIRVPGPGIAFLGGLAASVLLSISGLVMWVLAGDSAGVPAAVVQLLADLGFALGGIGFAGGLGLLIAGIAVPSLVLGIVPRWLAWTGLALGAIAELSFLCLLWGGFDLLLPLTRFGGLIWLAVVGFLFPRDRRDVTPTSAA